MKREADKIYEAKILEASKEAKKKPSERKIGDAKPLEDLDEVPEKIKGVDIGEVKKKIAKEVDEMVVKMMEEMGTLINSDEMGELLSAIETKEAFGDFDEELGKE
jgi:galactitol-specific phosphotransferase system IIB component